MSTWASSKIAEILTVWNSAGHMVRVKRGLKDDMWVGDMLHNAQSPMNLWHLKFYWSKKWSAH